jgi:hypothetical protein
MKKTRRIAMLMQQLLAACWERPDRLRLEERENERERDREKERERERGNIGSGLFANCFHHQLYPEHARKCVVGTAV